MQEYTFASHDHESEYKRLSLIQESFDEKSKKHLLKAGFRSGMDCLEVGLGAGSLALWMKKELDEEGSVLGVDLNLDYIDKGVEYDLLEGDILQLDISQRFDLIHLRYVLIHNLKAKDILVKLHSLLKPGGKLIVEEPDFTLAKWMDAPDLQACRRVNSAICAMYEKKGLKPHYGSIVHLQLQEACFEIDESKSYLHLCSGNEDVAAVMASSARALSDLYLQTGICSKEDINAYIDACENPDSLSVYYATIAITAQKKDLSSNIEEIPLISEPEQVYEEGIFAAKDDKEIFECLALMQELRPHIKSELFLAQIRQQMEEGYTLFYMRKDSEISVLAGCRISINLAWGKHLYIDDLVSSSDKRSLGNGNVMMEFLSEFAKEQACQQIHLDSGVQRFLSHKFYLREDFKIVSHHFSKAL